MRVRCLPLVAMLALSGVAMSSSPAFAEDPGLDVVSSQQRGSKMDLSVTAVGARMDQLDKASVTAAVDGKGRPVVEGADGQDQRVMLVLDTSGSMGTDGIAGARTAVREYLRPLPPHVEVGLVTFSTQAKVLVPPTKDRAEVINATTKISPKGGTDLHQAVRLALEASGSTGSRRILLLSDGADTQAKDEPAARAEVTSALRDSGVHVDVVRFRTQEPEAKTTLDGYAKAGSGRVIYNAGPAELRKAFKESATQVADEAVMTIDLEGVEPGPHTISIRGLMDGVPVRAEQEVDVKPFSKPAPEEASTTTVAGSSPSHLVLSMGLLLLFLGMALLAASVFLKLGPTGSARRLAALNDYMPKPEEVVSDEERARSIQEQLVGFGERRMQSSSKSDRTIELMRRADLPFRAGEWYVLRWVIFIVVSAVGLLLIPFPFPFNILAGMVLGWLAPGFVLKKLAKRRADKFERQLPDVMTLVATSLSSGFSLDAALQAVGRTAPEPSAKEFSRAMGEARFKSGVDEALESLAMRMDSTSLKWAVMAIRIQREVGGNLADTLRTTSAQLREREELHGQVKALSAEGKLSAYILMALPVGLFLYMMAVNREYVSPLWTTTLGLGILVASGVMFALGGFVMSRMIKIEV